MTKSLYRKVGDYNKSLKRLEIIDPNEHPNDAPCETMKFKSQCEYHPKKCTWESGMCKPEPATKPKSVSKRALQQVPRQKLNGMPVSEPERVLQRLSVQKPKSEPAAVPKVMPAAVPKAESKAVPKATSPCLQFAKITQNYKNSCYINALFVALFHEKDSFNKHIAVEPLSVQAKRLVKAIQVIVSQMQHGESTQRSMQKLRSLLAQVDGNTELVDKQLEPMNIIEILNSQGILRTIHEVLMPDETLTGKSVKKDHTLLVNIPRGSEQGKDFRRIRIPKVVSGLKLSAMIVHHGTSIDSGHYTCYYKCGGDWYHFNDMNTPSTDYVGKMNRSMKKYVQQNVTDLVYM
jgi:hypothetical protein